MNCPKCGITMEIDRQNISNNPDTGQQYDRTYYVCKTDDIWITTEIPKAK